MRIRFNVSHNAPAVRRQVNEFEAATFQAITDATEEGTQLLRNDVVRLVGARTTMSVAIAEEITESEFRPTPYGGRGEVKFKKAPAYIYPKNKKALAFTIDGQRIVRRRVRGSRPYKLIRMGATTSTEGLRRIYQDALKGVEAVK